MTARKAGRWRGAQQYILLYESLPTSSFPFVLGRMVCDFSELLLSRYRDDGCLLSSSAEESAVLRRLSTGEETDEVFRLLLPAGAYLSIDRCLFLSLRLLGLLLRLGLRRGRLCSRLLLRLR